MERWSFPATWWRRLATLFLEPLLLGCGSPGVLAEFADPQPVPVLTLSQQADRARTSRQHSTSPVVHPAAPLGQPFQLVVGATMLLPESGLALRFDQVLDDSRCAVDVECLWSGNATIVLHARLGTTSAQWERTLSPDAAKSATVGRNPIQYQGYTIEIQRLDPYPARADVPIPPSDYVVTLLVTRRASGHQRGHTGY